MAETQGNFYKIYVNYFNKAKVNYQNMIHNLEKQKEESKRSFESLQNQEKKLIEEIIKDKRTDFIITLLLLTDKCLLVSVYY